MRDKTQMLISAYAIDRSKGSEPGAGWQFVAAASQYADEVDVITRTLNVPHVKRQLEDSKIDNVRVYGVDASDFLQTLKERLPGGKYMYYLLWQRLAGDLAEKLHARKDFDLAHHVTYAGDWLPTFLSKSDFVPWVWGPVGGRAPLYLRFLRYMGVRGALTEILRYAGTMLPRRSFGATAARKSSLTLVQNDDVAAWAKQFSQNVKIFPNPMLELQTSSWQGQSSMRYIGVGRLLPWKGWSIVIEAFASVSDNISLDIFGDGRDIKRLRAKIARLGLDGRIRFRGNVPRERLLEELRQSKGIISASLRDSAGWSVAEAVTLGVPVVAIGAAGIGTLAGRSGVTTISPRSAHVVDELASLISSPPPAIQSDQWRASARYAEIWEMYDSVLRHQGDPPRHKRGN